MFASTVFVVVSLLCQLQAAQAPADDPTAQDAIARAVEKLGDARFSVRDEASRFLWQQGLQAEPALRQAARSKEVEIRLRAVRILQDFDYGILPSVPEDVLERIRQFRDGDSGDRQQAVQSLAEDQHWDTVTHLLRRESNDIARRGLLISLFRSEAAIDRFGTLEKTTALVESAAPDQDVWQRGMVGELLFSPLMIERLAAADQLSVLTEFLKGEKDPGVRALALNSVFNTTTSVNRLMTAGHWPLLRELVDAAPSQQHPDLMLQIMGNQELVTQLLREDQIDQLFELLTTTLEAPNAAPFLPQLFDSAAMPLILDQQGIDGILAWLKRKQDAPRYGERLAALMSSAAVQKWLLKADNTDLIVEIAAKELQPATRRNYIRGLLQAVQRRSPPLDVQWQRRLWELIKTDEDQVWQLETVVIALRAEGMREIAADEKEAVWLLKRVGEASAEQRLSLLQALSAQNEWLVTVLRQGHLDILIKAIEKVEPLTQQATLLGRVIRDPATVDYLKSKNQLEWLIAMAEEKPAGEPRTSYLQFLVSNRHAIAALLAEGHYEVLAGLIHATEDSERRAMLFGSLVIQNEVIHYLTQRNELGTLIDFAEALDSAQDRFKFLRVVFASDATKILLQHGFYDELHAFTEEESTAQEDLTAAFYGNNTVLRHFLKTHKVADLLTLTDSMGDASRYRILLALTLNRESFESLSGKESFERVAALIAHHPNASQRAALFENLLTAPELLRGLAMRDQLSLVVGIVWNEREAEARHRLLRGLVSNDQVVVVWTEAEQLGQLVELTDSARDSAEKADMLGRLVGTTPVLEHWSNTGRLRNLLELADSFTEADARHKYLHHVYRNHGTLKKMLERGLLEDLLEVAGRQPAEFHGSWLQMLAQNQATSDFLRSEGQIVRLLSIATDEPDEAVRQAYYAGLTRNHAAISALVEGGHYNPLSDDILSLADVLQRSQLLGRLTQHSSVVTYLSQRNLLSSFLTYAETQADRQAREVFLQAFLNSAALTALVQQGHYARVRAIVEQEPPLPDSLAALFYSNSSVVEQLLKANELDEIFQHIDALDPPARASFLSRITSNAKTAAGLIRAGHLNSLLALLSAADKPPQREVVLGKLLGSPEVLAQLATTNQLQQVVDLAMQSSDPNSQHMQTYSLTQSDAVDVWVRAEMIDPLILLVCHVSEQRQHADVLSRVVGTASVLRHWEEQGQLTKVFAPLDDLDAATRPEYLQRVLTNPQVMGKLIAAGLLEDSLRAIGQLPDARTRAAVLGWGARDISVTEQLISAGEMSRLLSFAREQTSEVQLSYLQGLLSNGRAIQFLIKEGHYDTLAAWILATDDGVRRADFFGLLMQQGTVVEHLRQRDELAQLVEFAENQTTAAARVAFLRPLVLSNTLTLLVEDGYYDRLRVMVEALASHEAGDNNAGEILVANFYSNPKVLDRFPQPEQLQGIVQRVAAMDSAEARHQFLQRTFSNSEHLKRLIDNDQLESLVTMIRRAPEDRQRQHLLARLITIPVVIDRLATQQDLPRVLDILRNEPNDEVREGLIGQVVSNRDINSKLVGAGLLPDLVTLIEELSDGQQRGELLGKLLGSSAVAEYLAAQGDLNMTKRIVQGGKPGSAQPAVRAMTLALLRDRKTLSRWMDAGLIDPLIELLTENVDVDQRADLLVQLVTAQPVLEQWSEDERLGSILTLASSLGDDQTRSPRQKYLARVFNHAAAIQLMVEAGMFEDLLSAAEEARQTDQNSTLLVSLLASPFVAEQLRGQGRMELMVELVVREQKGATRDVLLAGVLRNDAAVKGLIDVERFDPLVDAARQLAAVDERKPAMSQFLRSAIAVEYLEKSGELDAFVKALFDDLQHDLQSDFFKEMLRQGPALMAFEKTGVFDDLVQGIETADAETREELLSRVVNAPGGAQLLVQHDRTPLVISTLRASAGQDPNHNTLRSLLGQPQFLQAIADVEMLGSFLDQAEAIDRDSLGWRTYRRSLWESVQWSSDALLVLAENDQLERLLTIASEAPRPHLVHTILRNLLSSKVFDSLDKPQLAERLVQLAKQAVTEKDSSAVQMLLSAAGLRQTLIADGRVEALLGLLPLIDDERQRERYRQQILFSASGVVAHRVSQEDLDAAQKTLEESAAKSDEGIAMWASFLLTQGRLERRIEELQSEEDPPARMLAYLHRANGDLDAALAEATRSGDAGLIHYLTCEQRDWLAAAKQLAGGIIEPPVPLRGAKPNAQQAHIERLGFLAAYWRLAGDAEQAGKTIEEVKMFAAEHEADPMLQWRAAEALLLNDFTAPGLAALQRADPTQAFDALVARQQYSAALAAIGSAPGSAFDRDWYLGLPQVANRDPFASGLNAARRRLEFAIRVVEGLRQLGLKEDVQKVLLSLETYIQEQPNRTDESPHWKRMHEQWMAAELYRIGFRRGAWQHAERAITEPVFAASVVYAVFAERGLEAAAWSTYFGLVADEQADEQAAEQAFEARMRRVHRVLHRQLAGSKEDFERLVEQAAGVDSIAEHQRGTYLAGLAETCIDRARPDLAERLLRDSDRRDWVTRMRLGNVLRQQQKWTEAGEVFLEVWHADREQTAALYLSGDSLIRAGDAEEGKRRIELAGRLTLPSIARCRMANTLAEAGLADEAAEQWQIVIRTAPLASWEWYDSSRRYADHIRRSEPALAADLWEHYTLSMLRSNLHFSEVKFYLRMPFLIRWRRAVGAIERDDPKEAVHQAQWALAALPGDTEMVQSLIPDLEEKGEDDAADQLHDSVRQHYLESLQEFPMSAHLHNELAWHNARSHRHLDEAFEHARRAVEMRPRHGGHVDTLAEVHFQRGERERAIELSQQSLELAPANENFRHQLDRFRNDPLPDARLEPNAADLQPSAATR